MQRSRKSRENDVRRIARIDWRPSVPTASSYRYAPPALRDRFLASLESDDQEQARVLAPCLLRCANLLPSVTCVQLGLPGGSTYASAAQSVLERGAAP
jgi:hypothetical protein